VKRTIYLVMADTSYEGSTPICGFFDKRSAEEFRDKCIAHDRKRPQDVPPIEDSPENDAAWDRFTKKVERWERRHPAGKDLSCRNDFSVMVIRMRNAFSMRSGAGASKDGVA